MLALALGAKATPRYQHAITIDDRRMDEIPHGHVLDVEHVYAVGDATEFPIKHGGVGAQQADAVAESIASLAGAPVSAESFRPVIRRMLLTGEEPLYLTAGITGGYGFSSEITDTPTWDPPSKIATKYLSPYLDAYDREKTPT